MAGIDNLVAAIDKSPHSFLQPSPSLHADVLSAVKALLDPLAADVADAQTVRRDEYRKKRKRGESRRDEEVLQLRKVYIDGLGVKQIWEQSRRILDAACDEVERATAPNTTSGGGHAPGSAAVKDARTDDSIQDKRRGDGQLEEDEDEDDKDEDGLLDEEDDDQLMDENGFQDEDLDDEEGLDEDSDDLEGLDEIDDYEDSDNDRDDGDGLGTADPGTYKQDPNNLNDGFFSIDDFNKQTQFLEQQDARGEDDNPSDEDEIDWDADPLTMSFHKPKNTRDQQPSKETNGANEEDSEEEGPTFGDADLDADDSDEEMDPDEAQELDEMPGLSNTNDIRYADFFAPPPKKPSKTKRMRALPKTQPDKAPATGSDEEADLDRAMADVRRDLLDSESEPSDLESDEDGPSTRNMSTHEKQRAQIAAEIRKLEAANVAKRDWQLSGEAHASDRPLNSLIEEDLEFERTGKPVPVVTAKVSEEIEELIKRRIIAREFDEIVRRLPDAIGSASETRRGRVEVDDTKAAQGLAEVYEQDHLKATDPGYVDKRSAATKKAHEEIARLWKEVSSQLDVLSSLHFKPKRVEVEVKVLEDKPTIAMEDARPVGVEGESMLAPQEVYRAGEEKRKSDGDLVVRKSGASANKEEMSREEKLRRRRREKERTKKANLSKSTATAANSGNTVAGPKKGKKAKDAEQQEILNDLRKGNVKVIGKKGELTDVPGTKRKGGGASGVGGGALKL